MRFSLLSLLLFSLFAGLAAGALARPHWIWSASLSTALLISLCAAVLAVWTAPPQRAARHFAMGYLLVGGLYLLIAAPDSKWMGAELPTNALIRWIDRPAAIEAENNDYFTLVFNSATAQYQSIAPQSVRVKIGHWLWTMVVGFSGGWLAARLGAGETE